MDDLSVCTPQTAESDTQNNTNSANNAASVIDADKVINTKIDSSQGEGDTDEEELLRGLLTDTYCHVCDAVLQFESQRFSHYEGKRHAQKLKVYLQTKRAEKTSRESTGAQWTVAADKDRFCELCNMVFSSNMVSKSHYEGKVHAKNLRKQGLQSPVTNRNPEASTEVLPRPTPDPDKPVQSSATEGCVGHHTDLGATTATTATLSTEVDLRDPNKYCALCTASFNNPQMALQHYNGRKHQRNQSRQELMRQLGDDVQQASHLVCQICSLEFNSVEMYQAHVQGSKHQIREKKVIDLCRSQQKVYNTFADELADYVQVQKARGITPKTSQVLSQGDLLSKEEEEEEEKQEEEEEDEEGVQHVFNIPSFTPTPDPLHHSGPGYHYPVEGWPPYQRPAWPPHSWHYTCSPPVLPGPGSPQFSSRPVKGKRRRRQSSSSSFTASSTSSYSSSYSSSSTDESDDNEYKWRERRRIRTSKREQGRGMRSKDSDKEERRRRKRQRKEQEDNERTMRKRGQSVESEQEWKRRRQKGQGKRRKDKKNRQVEHEEEGGDNEMYNPTKLEDSVDSRKYNEVHIQTEMNEDQQEGGQDEATKAKYRKEKKKVKEKVDTRTEEEKLWDDSILGC